MVEGPLAWFAAAAATLTLAALAWVLKPIFARRGLVFAALVAVSTAAAGLYLVLGNPRALDDVHTLDAAMAVTTVPVSLLREDLAAQVARSPRDARAWIMLARLDAGEDRFAQAAEAFARGLAASPLAGNDASVWCEYADALGMAQGGSLAGHPRAIVMLALERNPAHPKALEMAGSAAFEERDYTQAARHWRALQAQLPPGSPAARELAAAIARADLVADAASSRGELLYSTHCIACHTRQMHWRDRKLATDWSTLAAQVRRWQRNAGLGWSDEDVEDVARHLNATIYRFPEAPAKATG